MLNEYVVLENEYLTMKISHIGASILEVTDFEGNILVSRNSGLCFPVCGGVYNNTLTLGESEYSVSENGFLKDCEFILLESYEDYAEFIFTANEDTVKNFPFSFNVIVTYKLLGKAATINCRIGNFSEYKMPYSFGINTYFPKGGIDVEFERDEVFEGYIIKNGLFCGDVKRVMPCNGKILNTPENGEYVIKNLISDSFKIIENGKTIAEISKQGFPHFNISSDVYGINFGLWQGFSGKYGKKDDFVNKDSIKFADENSSDEYSLLITFNL